jgi:hypothetical protein
MTYLSKTKKGGRRRTDNGNFVYFVWSGVLKSVIAGGPRIWLEWRERRNTYRILLQNVLECSHLEGSDRHRRVILFKLFIYGLLTLPVIQTI